MLWLICPVSWGSKVYHRVVLQAGHFKGGGLAVSAVFHTMTGDWIIELSGDGYTQMPLSAFLGSLP